MQGSMKRKALLLLLFLVLWAVPLPSAQNTLKINDIQRVMDRFFSYHIENKELTPALVRRSFKLYIEQFDPDKSYLMENEAAPYLNLSDKRAAEILERLKNQDYSDFIALNRTIQNAILRAEEIRKKLSQQLAHDQLGMMDSPFSSAPSRYASLDEDLIERQRMRMIRFYLFQKTRTPLDTMERKAKVYLLFEKKVRRLEYNYLFLNQEGKPLPKERIEHLMALRILKSFAKSLDTHTSFFSPEEAYEMRLSLEKQFEGVGVVLSEGIDGIMISELIPGSPAEQSGKIEVNDLLVSVDGKNVGQISFEEVLDLLKKKDRGEILLGLQRNGGVYEVALKKRPIVMNEERIETKTEKFGNGLIGKIALHSFYESGDGVSSEKDLKEAIRSFKQKGELLGLVLDLRENSGGFLSQAVRVAGLFVSNGVIVISKYGQGEVHYLRNIVGKSFFNGPLVILTSKMSASASEIVAQALQDYGVALVVGDERTFGKGSIQYQTVTDEKAELFFKVTVGRYYTVSGKSTQIDGVKADIVVPTQYSPYNIGEKFLEYPLPPDQVEAAYVDPLSDLDERTRHIFQVRYLPFLQRVVPFWKRMLPALRKNSAYRLAHDPNFQAFLKKLDAVRARQDSIPVNSIDEAIQIGMEDLQMMEAVNIVKDMVLMEAESRPAPTAKEDLLKTGTDGQ
jgi:carboxyl-terminal processing protease